tara:strand:- start:907 stop:1215 length:309 start_codon:yes stop_codon:yes gene_type:complete
MKIFFYFILMFLLLSACGGLSDAKKVLKNEKISNTDEFLVKKKEPLILPPEFDKLPTPNSKNSKNKTTEKEKLKKILKAEDKNFKDKNTSSSLEENIIEKIR